MLWVSQLTCVSFMRAISFQARENKWRERRRPYRNVKFDPWISRHPNLIDYVDNCIKQSPSIPKFNYDKEIISLRIRFTMSIKKLLLFYIVARGAICYNELTCGCFCRRSLWQHGVQETQIQANFRSVRNLKIWLLTLSCLQGRPSVFPHGSNSTGRIFRNIMYREFLINFVARFKFWLSATKNNRHLA
jgi:hypothetical protein